MRILFQSRVDLFNPRGGDTYQIEHTKKALEKLYPEVEVDIRPELKVGDIDKYDLVHLFNLDWICETYIQAKWAKKHGKPVVLSAIHHSEGEVKRYENEYRFGVRRLYNAVIPWQSTRDVWKNIYRSIFNPAKAYPTLVQLLKGIRNEQREIIRMSDCILVQTKKEAEDIKKDFKICKLRWKKVVNGVNLDVFTQANKDKAVKVLKRVCKNVSESIVLVVGRVEPRKNQLSVLKAYKELIESGKLSKEWGLVFIGEYNKRHPEYSWKFNRELKRIFGKSRSQTVCSVGPQAQEVVASFMKMPGIFVNASWFETTGLVALEASLCAMPSVVSGERVKEYLGANAQYCDPGSIRSIKNAILKASKKGGVSKSFRRKVAYKYSWSRTAEQTMEVYQKLLKE